MSVLPGSRTRPAGFGKDWNREIPFILTRFVRFDGDPANYNNRANAVSAGGARPCSRMLRSMWCWIKWAAAIATAFGSSFVGSTLEDRVAGRLDEVPRPHRFSRRNWLCVAAAAFIAVVSLAVFWMQKRAPGPVATNRSYPRLDTASGLAMVIELDRVVWEPTDEPEPIEGDVVGAGRLRLKSGRATISMLTGVMIVVEGPADIELVSGNQIYCRRGKLRTRVPAGAEGFVVSAPGSAVMDIGTEFAMNLTTDGRNARASL